MSFQTILMKFAYLQNLTRLIQRRDLFFSWTKESWNFTPTKKFISHLHWKESVWRICTRDLRLNENYVLTVLKIVFDSCHIRPSFWNKWVVKGWIIFQSFKFYKCFFIPNFTRVIMWLVVNDIFGKQTFQCIWLHIKWLFSEVRS